MYESPSVNLLVTGGPTYLGTYAASVAAYSYYVWAAGAVATVGAYANVAAATLAVVALAFLWVVGAVFFNSGMLPLRE